MAASKVVFAWENLGPSHCDRLLACNADPGLEPVAIELFAASTVYDWGDSGCEGLKRHTLLPRRTGRHWLSLFRALLKTIRHERPDAVFLCHYNELGVFFCALALRLGGVPVFAMFDSKYDDMPRWLPKERLKSLMLLPYSGALAGSRRSVEYLRFLGLRKQPIVEGFDSLDIARLQALIPAGERSPAHHERDFLVVARLIREKNLELVLHGYALWTQRARHARRLRILGSGPLEASLKGLADGLGIADRVDFEGSAGPEAVARAMRGGLALLFPSVQETFGFVVIEALAQGLPVLISPVPGAVDGLIDDGANGWVIDPHSPEALADAMALLDRDEAVWQAASAAALASAERGDVVHFVAGVKALLQAG